MAGLVGKLKGKFLETTKNFKSVFSFKAFAAASKKKLDAAKKLLNPDLSNPKDMAAQLRGEKAGLIDSITPKQVKQLAQGYKAGLKMEPKEALTSTLEQFTGVNLDQNGLLKSLGAAAKDYIKNQITSLKGTIEKQILGCVNKIINDLLNKFPVLDFLLNFEEKIKGILGKFRNKLERKIDAELSSLMYKKIKIHQLTLFKQKVHGAVRKLCPSANPASASEVKQFKASFQEGIRERNAANELAKTNQTVSVETRKPKTIPSQTPTPGPSAKQQRELFNNPEAVAAEQIKGNEDIGNAINDVATSQSQDVSENVVWASDNKDKSIVPTKEIPIRSPWTGETTYVYTGRGSRGGKWMTDKDRAAVAADARQTNALTSGLEYRQPGAAPENIVYGGVSDADIAKHGGGVSDADIAKHGHAYYGLEDPDALERERDPWETDGSYSTRMALLDAEKAREKAATPPG